MDPEFRLNDALRAILLRESGSYRQQLSLLGMYEHRQVHGVPVRGGGRRPRGVSYIRREMLREQIVAIMLSPSVLSFTRAMGERLSSGPVITSGTINEFRAVHYKLLQRSIEACHYGRQRYVTYTSTITVSAVCLQHEVHQVV